MSNTSKSCAELHDEFCALLRSTGREGVDDTIQYLERLGFFKAPASVNHHLNCDGGLTQHSLGACHAALQVWEGLKELDPAKAGTVSRESVIIATLLHDVCKSCIYKPMVKRKKNRDGMLEDVKSWDVRYDYMPLGHGEKSVIMLLRAGMQLTDEEILAIRWHMGAFGLNHNSLEDTRSLASAKRITPLVTIVQMGDSLAAGVIERTALDIDNLR